MIWEKLLTDTDGQYVELQSGRLFNQAAEGSMYSPFKHVSFMPYTHDSWTEYWYPVKNTRGLTHATPQGAINLRVQDGWLKLDYCAVSLIHDTLTIWLDYKPLMVKKLELKPLEVIRDSVRWTGDTEKLSIRLGNEIIADGQPTATQRPLEAPKDFDWNSEYGLYRRGKDLMNQRKYAQAESYFNKVLEKNKYYVDALVDLAEIKLYRIGPREKSFPLIAQALSVNAYHSKTNYLRGMINRNNTGSYEDAFAVAAMDASYRSPALTQLTIRAIRTENWQKAMEYVQQAIDANSHNADALQMEIVTARKTGQNAKALKLAQQLLYQDPLNHFARFENYLLTKTEEDKTQFKSLIRSELPHETFLEIALWYDQLRLFDEGLEVLEMAPKEVMVLLWKAEFLSQLNRYDENEQVFQEALKRYPEGVFPFRWEDLPILLNAFTRQGSNWKTHYYWMLVEWVLNRRNVERSFRDFSPPAYVPYYLVKAEVFKNQKDTARQSLEYACKLEPKNWRVVKALADFYAENGQLKKALEINESRLSKSQRLGKSETPLPDHELYILGQQRAQLLLKAERYKECIELMQSLTILPNEGASGAHALFREANIRYAAELSNRKKYKEAQLYLEQAETWPENLGSGEPYDPDNRLTNYLKKFVNQKLKHKEPEAADLLKLSKGLSAKEFDLLKLFE